MELVEKNSKRTISTAGTPIHIVQQMLAAHNLRCNPLEMLHGLDRMGYQMRCRLTSRYTSEASWFVYQKDPKA